MRTTKAGKGVKHLPHALKMLAKKGRRANRPSPWRDVALFAGFWRAVRARNGVGRPVAKVAA